MSFSEKELIERFARFTDEELERVLATGRAKYSWDELMMASWELSQRQAQPPAPREAPLWPPSQAGPPAAHVKQGPKSPYMFIDLVVDALLFGSLYWVTGKLGGGTLFPGAWLLDTAMRLLLSASVTVVITYLRHRWRMKEWRD